MSDLDFERTMTRMPLPARSVVLSALLASLLSACAREDECRVGSSHCEGDVAMNCLNFGGRSEGHLMWVATTCGAGMCKLDPAGDGNAFCALEANPNPRCDKRAAFCDGTTVTSCRVGHVVATRNCATSEPESKVCVPLTRNELPEPQPLDAMCARAREPSSLCGSGSSDYACNGDEVVVCEYGYEIARYPCAEGLSCRPLGLCAK